MSVTLLLDTLYLEIIMADAGNCSKSSISCFIKRSLCVSIPSTVTSWPGIMAKITEHDMVSIYIATLPESK